MFHVTEQAFTAAAGELVEMTAEMIAQVKAHKRRELIKARTEAELIELGTKRQYKNPVFWAGKIIEGRQQYSAQRQVSHA